MDVVTFLPGEDSNALLFDLDMLEGAAVNTKNTNNFIGKDLSGEFSSGLS